MSFSSGPGFLELFNIVQYCNTKESDCDFLVDPGFLEIDNSVQYCNTKESDCDFLVDPGFLEVDNSATGKLQYMSGIFSISSMRNQIYEIIIGHDFLEVSF